MLSYSCSKFWKSYTPPAAQIRVNTVWYKLKRFCKSQYNRDSNSLSGSFQGRPTPNSHLAGLTTSETNKPYGPRYGTIEARDIVADLARAAKSRREIKSLVEIAYGEENMLYTLINTRLRRLESPAVKPRQRSLLAISQLIFMVSVQRWCPNPHRCCSPQESK